MLVQIIIVLIALIHAYFTLLEMALWERPRTRRIFGTTAEFAAQTRVLAGNQGLYNGFLAAGLIFGLWLGAAGLPMLVFLLLCIVVAGLYGAATATRAAFWAQSVPALVALALIWAGVFWSCGVCTL